MFFKLKNWQHSNDSSLLFWASPVKSFTGALLLYGLVAFLTTPSLGASSTSYFNYLADAFLHRQAHLRLIPASTHDLVLYKGLYYLYWPPLPAILLIPFVSLWGVGVSDIIYNLLIAAFNVGLVSLLLENANQEKIISLSLSRRAWITIFFAFGTVHFALAPYGRVWATGQLIAFGCTLWAYIAAISYKGWRAFFFTGFAIAAAMMTRNHLLVIGLWPSYYLIKQYKFADLKKISKYIAIGVLPILIAGLGLAIYNWIRFDSFFELGLDYHQMSSFFTKDYEKYGAFHPNYITKNFYYQYIYYPFPVRSEFPMGGSLFLLSPIFFSIFWAFPRKDVGISTFILGLTVLIVSVPIFFLMGTGWVQFGPRYTLDFTTPLLLLVARGISNWSDRIIITLIFISIVHYLVGTIIIGYFF